ncbi:MAG: AbgT family transporter [Lachnospiraceae bacterium]|nr:AbgT family transporter [Lachnospiraceae bacterium]
MLRFISKSMDKKIYEEKKSSMHPMMLMVYVVLLCTALSYIIPAGQYDREYSEETGVSLLIPDSFHYVERTHTNVLDVLMSLTKGMQQASYIIFFLMIVGGMFSIMNGTGALNIALANGLKRMKGREILMIPLLMIFFGCGAAFCGNFEEFLVFVPIILACCMTVGYDSLTAVGIIFFAATAGYGGAVTNAFTEGVAQEIAGLPKYSGAGLRSILFIILLAASILYVMINARIVKENHKFSGSYSYDKEFNRGKMINMENIPPLKKRHILAILTFLAGLVFTVIGIIKWDFYIDELAGIFLAVGILCGVIGGLKTKDICDCFIKGCKDMILPCIMIGLANASMVILNEANVLDTILYSMAGLLRKVPDTLMPIGMFVFHEIFNIFVPSGSAQANITMPLMVVLADNAHITRQTAVLAYQLGDAFTNIMSPTGGEILAALAICRVPFVKWVRYLLPLFIIWWLIAFVVLLVASGMGYGPM